MNKFYSIILFVLFNQLITAQSVATYTIELETVWNNIDHSNNGNTPLPSNAHWSNLIGATHDNISLFEMGSTASQGLEDVAEVGVNTTFRTEINNAISNNTADQLLEQSVSPFNAIAGATFTNVEINSNYPLLTLASMIAPSPDWFIGISNYSLLDINGEWKDSIEIDLFPYDAGTENGTTYSINNAATNPQGVITSLVNIAPFNNEKIATLTITLESVASQEDLNSLTELNIYPNPVKDRLTIQNTNINPFKTVQLFNILGKSSFLQNLETTETTIQVNHLPKGVYFAEFIRDNNDKTIKKIVIQ